MDERPAARDPGPAGPGPEPLEEIEEEVRRENPDRITEREAFELALMEEGRSEEGSDVELEKDPPG